MPGRATNHGRKPFRSEIENPVIFIWLESLHRTSADAHQSRARYEIPERQISLVRRPLVGHCSARTGHDVTDHRVAISPQLLNTSAANLNGAHNVPIDMLLGHLGVRGEHQIMRAVENLSLAPRRWKKFLAHFLIGDHDKFPRLQSI